MAKELEKIPVRFKVKPEDFIVEELAWGDNCKISSEDMFNQKPDLSKLDVNDVREFLVCDFEKKNIETFKAKKEFSYLIRKGVDAIGFAGIKDKKAWTCQRISIFKPDLEQIRNFSHPDIYLKNFKWAKRKIKVGYLEGNRFTIVIREIEKKDAIKVTNQIRKKAFIANYFGKQRFGSVRENNAKIGYLIIKKKFKEAIELILTDTNSNEQEETTQARIRLAKEKDYKAALEYFPRYLYFERRLISYLSEKPDDYLGAIKICERKNMLMYVNSVQSKIFNEVLETALFENIDFTQKGQMRIPLFGYRSKIDEGKLGEIEQEILKQNKISPEDFRLIEIPYLSARGDYRLALIEIKNMDVEILEDEIYVGSKKIILKFDLPSGVYATTFLENFFDLIEERNEKPMLPS